MYSLAEGQFAEWGAKLADGGSIVLVGTYKSYNNTPEVVDATIESFEADPNYKYCKVDKKEISVAATATEAEFKITANAAWTVTLTSSQNNVAIIPARGDADATVKVTFPANTSTEAAVVYTFKLACDAASVSETLTITQAKVGTESYTSNVTWPETNKDERHYSEKATVNDVADVDILKLGTGSATGSCALTLPAGSTKLTFYAISWKGKASKLVFKIDGTEVGSVNPAANDGLANNSPYTVTVSDSDKYTITFSATSTMTVETSGSNTRAAIFAVNAE